MCRPILILGAFAVLFIATAYSQIRIIRPTYRPPVNRPRYPIRIAREARDEPPQLRNEDFFHLPTERSIIYDDVNMDPNRRYVRSLSTPGRGRGSGSSSGGSRGHDTGPTHPGYNRRNAREAGEETDHFIHWPSTKDRIPPSMYKDVNLYDPSASHVGRNIRSLNFPTPLPPFNPKPRPWNPPTFPIPTPQRPRLPIYV